MRHTVEEKLNAIAMVASGMSPRMVSRKLHLGHHSLYDWLTAYKEKGVSGLESNIKNRRNHLSFEEKRKIILESKKSDLPLYQIAAKNGIGASTLQAWMAKVEQSGMNSLVRKKRKPKAPGQVRMKRIPKEECEKENERLRKENERLRAEVLLLKKVKALVEEREARNRRIGRGPSKN